ncbi:nucleolar protein 56-like [Lytechinus variegatus]|uniref:nucleolar protein 56-like n=1 Tax=Lytechinus variegatus TaxID=7654 RepID=UPI001BB10220|nr:nucleolar protein 56-like [Lytechinus variegatus]
MKERLKHFCVPSHVCGVISTKKSDELSQINFCFELESAKIVFRMAMMVLFEHASGYGLFAVKEFEEVSVLHHQVQESVTDFGKFASLIKLQAFSPFKSGVNALDNINSISEGVMTEDLKLFLETNMPESSKKRKKITLGVADGKIGASIQEELGIPCQTGGVFQEIARGLRYHFYRLVKGLTAQTEAKAQLGLGHSYSRAKVKFNVNRADNMIIQSICLLDQLDKDINTFSMRIKEWYSYHFPELVKVVPDNALYAKVAHFIKNRKELTDESLEALEELTMDSGKAQAILDASRSSMGMDISPIDLINIERFATRVIALTDYRKSLHTYLQDKMHAVAPNLSALIGEQVGARLISHAGSLTNLAKYPASTVQILGAEKALFRALKTRGNTPKYGLIFHSTFIGRAGQKNKGRISRYLANKCSMASRIDCFSDIPNSVFGEKLKDQVEERLSFYETGTAPRKNIDVMQEALIQVKEVEAELARKKKKEKKKKRKASEVQEPPPEEEEEVEEEQPKKKKKKTKVEAEPEPEQMETETPKKKKKKKKEQAEEEAEEEKEEVEDTPKEKKKKKKSLGGEEQIANVEPEEDEVTETVVKKKKKKKKSLPE